MVRNKITIISCSTNKLVAIFIFKERIIDEEHDAQNPQKQSRDAVFDKILVRFSL